MPTPTCSPGQLQQKVSNPKSLVCSIELRIMPLVASITYGIGSDDGNSYRSALHDLLTERGNKVDMVSSRDQC